MKKESESYQAMLNEVEAIVREVNSPSLDLDLMVEKVERGYNLIKKMQDRLESTKKRIDQLSGQFESQCSQKDTAE